MAATNGTFDAGQMTIFIGDEAVAYAKSVSLSVNPSLREIKNKTDGRWTVRKQGRLDISGSCSAMYAELDGTGSAITNMAEVWGAILAGTEVTVRISNDNVGDYEWSGPAQFSGMNINAGDFGESVEGDISFMASGAWTYTVISA